MPRHVRRGYPRRPALRSREERDALVHEYGGIPRYVVLTLLRGHPVVRECGAADLIQDASVLLLRIAELWDPARSARFTTYAIRAIRQHLLSRHAERKARLKSPRRPPLRLSALRREVADRREPGPVVRAERAERDRNLRAAVAALPAPLAAAVEARHLRGEPVATVARAAGVPAHTVYERLRRGLRLLRAALVDCTH